MFIVQTSFFSPSEWHSYTWKEKNIKYYQQNFELFLLFLWNTWYDLLLN